MDINAYIESGVIESYVLGMAEAQEAKELEQLSLQYPEIKRAIEDFEVSLEKAALANASAPNPMVKDQLLFALKDEFVSSVKSVPVKQEPPVRNMGFGWMRIVAAASVILLIASSALNVYFYSRFSSVNDKYVALLSEKNNLEASNNSFQTKMLDIYNSMQLMSDPNMIKVSMPGIKGRENNLATVFWDHKTKDVYLLANKLPQATPDKQYQLWALVDGKPVDAGLLDQCNGLCKLKNIPNAQGFAITLEKKGGSPSPTMSEMYVFGKA